MAILLMQGLHITTTVTTGVYRILIRKALNCFLFLVSKINVTYYGYH